MGRKTAKQRAEMAEYTSLIRSLHTTSTQDALPHLLVPTSVSAPFFSGSRTASPTRQIVRLATPNSPPSPSFLSDEDTQVKVIRSDLVGKDTAMVRNESREEDVPARDRRSDVVEEPRKRGKGRSTWTRWPLLKKDVYIPEWTLQDEVQALASRATREWINTYVTIGSDTGQEAVVSQTPADDEAVECSNPGEDRSMSPTNPRPSVTQADTGDIPVNTIATEGSPARSSSLESIILHPGVISGLTLEAENLLSRIFGALAAQWPLVDKSLQDRLRPMDWRAVLEIVGQAGIVNPEIVRRVQHRLEEDQHTEAASPSADSYPAHLDPVTSSRPLAALTRSEALQRRRRKVADLEEELGEDPFEFTDNPYRKKGTRKRRRKGSTAQMEDG